MRFDGGLLVLRDGLFGEMNFVRGVKFNSRTAILLAGPVWRMS